MTSDASLTCHSAFSTFVSYLTTSEDDGDYAGEEWIDASPTRGSSVRWGLGCATAVLGERIRCFAVTTTHGTALPSHAGRDLSRKDAFQATRMSRKRVFVPPIVHYSQSLNPVPR